MTESYFERDPESILPEVPVLSQFCYCSLYALEELIPCGTVTDPTVYNLITNAQVDITSNIIIAIFVDLGNRKKRSLSVDTQIDNVDLEYYPGEFDYSTNPTNEITVSWPTASGITEQQAWQHCNTTLTQAVSGCANYTTLLDDVIIKCVEDIQVCVKSKIVCYV